MAAEPLRMAVVGAGVGRQHAQAFAMNPGLFEVKVICDVNLERAQWVAEEANVPQAVSDLENLYTRDDLDVIDLCTPSGLHYQQTLKALWAGKHVILEKPAASSLKEVDELIAAEQQSGRRVMPIYQYRFRNGVRRLKHLVNQGIPGPAYLTTVETCWRRRPSYYATWHGKWATELGGAVVTLAIHANDILYDVLGPAKSVFARIKTLVNPIETEDTLSASLEMADGSLASISVTTGSTHEITRQRFCFQNLVAESNTAPYRFTADPWTFTGDTPEADAQIQAALADFVPLAEGFEGQFVDFAAALRENKPFPVSLQDARRSIELITAIYASAWSGQPVDLPLGQDHPLYAGWLQAVPE